MQPLGEREPGHVAPQSRDRRSLAGEQQRDHVGVGLGVPRPELDLAHRGDRPGASDRSAVDLEPLVEQRAGGDDRVVGESRPILAQPAQGRRQPPPVAVEDGHQLVGRVDGPREPPRVVEGRGRRDDDPQRRALQPLAQTGEALGPGRRRPRPQDRDLRDRRGPRLQPLLGDEAADRDALGVRVGRDPEDPRAADERHRRVADDAQQVSGLADRPRGPAAARRQQRRHAVGAADGGCRTAWIAAVVDRPQDELAAAVQAAASVEPPDGQRRALGVGPADAGVGTGQVGGLQQPSRRRATGGAVADGERRRSRLAATVDRRVGEPGAGGRQVDRRRPRLARAAAQLRPDLPGRAGAAQPHGDRPRGPGRRPLLERRRIGDDHVAARGRRGHGQAQQLPADRGGRQRRAAEDVALLGGHGATASGDQAGEHRGQHQDRHRGQRLGPHQPQADGLGGARIGRAAPTARRSGVAARGRVARRRAVAAAQPAGRDQAGHDCGGHQRDLDRQHPAVAGPAQVVPAVDLAEGGDEAGDREHDDRADRERREGPDRPAAAAQHHQGDQPARPETGGEPVQAAEERGDEGAIAETLDVAVGPVGGEGDGARGGQQRVAARVATRPQPQREAAEQATERQPREGDPAVAVARQQGQRGVADAGGRQHGDGLGGPEEGERERDGRQAVPASLGPGTALVARDPPAEQHAAEQRGRAEQPQPADGELEPALAGDVLAPAGADPGRRAAAEPLRSRGRGALRSGDAEPERAGGRVAVGAERDPLHVVDRRAQRSAERRHQQRVVADAQRAGRDPRPARATDLDRRAARDHALGERQPDVLRWLVGREPAERGGLDQRRVRRRGGRQQAGEEQGHDECGRGGDPPRPRRHGPLTGARDHRLLRGARSVAP
ncbi:hypothetical protein PAI11_13380 [Patulibacter medicamentivorans]|uniref:Uncharacterized protein n=1 Tax=Patulibacter medicamentivorans TaxID=1097667 RepID=H0E3G7_9ACTN|nr:hypothetical protein PAI11_13380 [Patulibacter medicamentivorans]